MQHHHQQHQQSQQFVPLLLPSAHWLFPGAAFFSAQEGAPNCTQHRHGRMTTVLYCAPRLSDGNRPPIVRLPALLFFALRGALLNGD